MEEGGAGWFSSKGNSEEPPPVLQREIQEVPGDHGSCGHLGHRVEVPHLPAAWTDDEL